MSQKPQMIRLILSVNRPYSITHTRSFAGNADASTVPPSEKVYLLVIAGQLTDDHKGLEQMRTPLLYKAPDGVSD
jgi:hypothetical protein